MAYSAPNPMNFNLLDGAYTFPNPLVFNFSELAVSYNFNIASPTDYTRHTSIEGSIGYNLQPSSALSHGHGINGSVSYGFSTQGDLLYSSNTGGRLTLVATTNYDPPDGGSVYLQVTAGTMIIGFERRPTATLTASLGGSTIVTDQQPDAVSVTAVLEGSVIVIEQAADQVTLIAESSGAVAFLTEPAPSFVLSGGMLNTLALSGTFTQPALAGHINDPDNVLKGLGNVPTTTFEGEIIDAPYLSLDSQLTQPIPLMSMDGSDLGMNFAAIAQAPMMLGSLLGQGNFSWVDTLQQAALSGEILSGGLLNLFATVEEPTLNGEILFQEFILDLVATGQQAESTGNITQPLGFSAEIPQPTLSLVEADAFVLYGELPTSSLEGSISSGLLLDVLAQIPTLLGDMSLNGSSATAWVAQQPAFSGDISGGFDNYLKVNFDAPVANFEILRGSFFALQGSFDQPAMRSKIEKTGLLDLYGEFPILNFAGGDGLTYNFTGTMPTMLSDMRINSTVIDFQ